MTSFKNWITDTESEIETRTNYLIAEALKQPTYGAAKRWLKKNKPDLSNSFNATPSECFNTVIAAMYDEAIRTITIKAMGQEVNKDASV